MFARKPSLPNGPSTQLAPTIKGINPVKHDKANHVPATPIAQADSLGTSVVVRSSSREIASLSSSKKRSALEASNQRSLKRSKSGTATPIQTPATGKGQQSLKGFLMAKNTALADPNIPVAFEDTGSQYFTSDHALQPAIDSETRHAALSSQEKLTKLPINASPSSTPASQAPASTGTHSTQASPSKDFSSSQDTDAIHDPIQSKESWLKLFTKPAPPLCEGHEEPCKTMLTKKNGMNRGRSFWMCARPLGPSGEKEKHTQWRCHTFIWCSDWNPTASG